MKGILSKYLSERSATIIFYCVTIFLMEMQYVCFLRQIGDDQSLFQIIPRTIGEVLLLTSPYWFAGRKWRKVLFVLPLLFTVFVLSNILLYRSWGDIMGLSYLQFTGNINSNLLLSAASLWEPGDWWILVIGILPTGLYFILRPVGYRFRPAMRWWLTGLSALICLGGYVIRVRGIYKYFNLNDETGVTLKEAFDFYARRSQQNSSAMENGVAVYLKLMMADLPEVVSAGSINLTKKEKEEIRAYLNSLPELKSEEFAPNRDKNLIMIIVESLDSYMVDRVINGEEVTPTLNRMLKEDGTIQARKVISQVGEGRSVDGQLILNTGLLPLPKGITWMKYPRYFEETPSLPKLFGKDNSYCLFCTDGKYWQEESFEKQIGVGTTAINADYSAMIDNYGADGALFKKGLEIAGMMREPFMLTMVTSSMHTPYIEPKAERIEAFRKGEEELTARYHEMTRYFDKGLGEFIEGLKRLGLYDNSVIVVVSDHSRTRSFGNQKEMETFFAAFNTGVTAKVERTVGQVNLYPTILTILNRENPGGYKGIAPSIIYEEVTGAADSQGNVYGTIPGNRSLYQLSEKMIKGNYK